MPRILLQTNTTHVVSDQVSINLNLSSQTSWDSLSPSFAHLINASLLRLVRDYLCAQSLTPSPKLVNSPIPQQHFVCFRGSAQLHILQVSRQRRSVIL